MRTVKKIILLIFILTFSNSGWAAFEFYQGVRALGMGGASIAVTNDETAILQNANGLSRLRDYFFTPIDPEITGSTTRTDALTGTAVFGSISPQQVYDQLSRSVDAPYYFKGQVFPSIAVPNFGLGLLGKYEVLAQRNTDGTYDYNYRNDYALATAYNLRFWQGRIKIGFTGKLIDRVEYFGTRDPGTGDSLELSAFAREGMGIAVDTGLTLAAPWRFLPTLSILVRDLGGTSFTAGDGFFGLNGNGVPGDVAQSIDVAVAVFPILSNHNRATMTAEYTGVLDFDTVSDHMDRLHLGMEFNLKDQLFFRGGYHANDWTAGFEYAADLFQLQLATYAEDILLNGVTKRDRRGVIKFAIRF